MTQAMKYDAGPAPATITDLGPDLRWIVAIAERECDRLLGEQNNTSRAQARQLALAIRRVKKELLG